MRPGFIHSRHVHTAQSWLPALLALFFIIGGIVHGEEPQVSADEPKKVDFGSDIKPLLSDAAEHHTNTANR
ncbi:MAG: hypothetical protein GY903_22675 [Fuerstiella sp.]|nr:hypothetical protein [Fuerstiella sp.]MCP4857297.1 hypothetical protein [Fuerstiella sp.]